MMNVCVGIHCTKTLHQHFCIEFVINVHAQSRTCLLVSYMWSTFGTVSNVITVGIFQCDETLFESVSMRFDPFMFSGIDFQAHALWSRATRNPDVSTGPITNLFACSLTPHCLFHRAHSVAHSLTAHTLTPQSPARGKVNHSALRRCGIRLFWTIALWSRTEKTQRK